jgi:hypothetical protein
MLVVALLVLVARQGTTPGRPGDDAPVEEAPADEAPADEAPADEAPVDEAPVDEAPVDEAPLWVTTRGAAQLVPSPRGVRHSSRPVAASSIVRMPSPS